VAGFLAAAFSQNFFHHRMLRQIFFFGWLVEPMVESVFFFGIKFQCESGWVWDGGEKQAAGSRQQVDEYGPWRVA